MLNGASMCTHCFDGKAESKEASGKCKAKTERILARMLSLAPEFPSFPEDVLLTS